MAIQTFADEPTVVQRLVLFLQNLNRHDKRSLIGMFSFVAILHIVGFGVLFGLVAPGGFYVGGEHQIFTAGVGILAYTFGLRHAFDVDHIAAVDNTIRKLLTDRTADEPAGQPPAPRPLSVGFWFSLGHSTVVFALAFMLAAGASFLAGQVEDEGSVLRSATGIIGPSVSGVFLWVLAISNLVGLVAFIRIFRKIRAGQFDETELEEQLNKRGLLNRLLSGVMKSIRKPWHIYPVGVLFGLGFDTAIEVALLVVAGGAAALILPFYAVLVLPVLFAAGMCLMDTIDGVFMNAAYGWAFAKPVRKCFYNITITSISVGIALVIGTIQLVTVLDEVVHITSGPLAVLGEVNLDYAGYAIVALFAAVWILALVVWRYGRVEQKWSAKPSSTEARQFSDS